MLWIKFIFIMTSCGFCATFVTFGLWTNIFSYLLLLFVLIYTIALWQGSLRSLHHYREKYGWCKLQLCGHRSCHTFHQIGLGAVCTLVAMILGIKCIVAISLTTNKVDTFDKHDHRFVWSSPESGWIHMLNIPSYETVFKQYLYAELTWLFIEPKK